MMEKKTVRLTPNAEVVRFLRKSHKLVEQLPEWKRGVLEVSSLTTNSDARTPSLIEADEEASSARATQ